MVRVQRDGAFAVWTIARPEAKNALNLQTLDDLFRIAKEARKDASLRAVVLTGEGDADQISRTLRSTAYAQLTGTLKGLADIGIDTKGTDNSLTLGSSTKLDDALANHLANVKALFADSTTGLAVTLNAYLDRTIGDSGTLVAKQANLTKQSAGIDTQIADMERVVQSNRQRLLASFTAMETAQARITQQQQYLTRAFP